MTLEPRARGVFSDSSPGCSCISYGKDRVAAGGRLQAADMVQGDERMTVMGIDPGLGSTGWAVVTGEAERPVLSGYGAIHTDPRLDPAERLLLICNGIRELLSIHEPTEVAIEDVFLAKDTRAALALGQARGAAMLGAALAGVPVRSYSAREVKQSVTGNGQASKGQVAYMIERLFGLTAPPRPTDSADAAAIALCHLHRHKAIKTELADARR